jgi:hypothetical protein
MRGRHFGQLHFRRHGRNDSAGHILLHREHVFQCAIEMFRPELVAVDRVDQLGSDPQAVAGLAGAAFEHVMHAEFAGHLTNIGGFVFVGKRNVAGDHEQRGEP